MIEPVAREFGIARETVQLVFPRDSRWYLFETPTEGNGNFGGLILSRLPKYRETCFKDDPYLDHIDFKGKISQKDEQPSPQIQGDLLFNCWISS